MSKSWFEGVGHTRYLYRRYKSDFPLGCPWWAIFAANGSLYGFGSQFCKARGALRLYFDIPGEPDAALWWDCYKQKWHGTRCGRPLDPEEQLKHVVDLSVFLNDWKYRYTVVYPAARHDHAYYAVSLEDALNKLLGLSHAISQNILKERPIEIYKPGSDTPLMIFDSLDEIPREREQP